ncbi:MYND Zn-finger protein [Ceratobasidium sp. AG-Ba]|nr:MYND Zn-finger protein [Ceratobasidium sp. AG-Ba]
MASSAELVPLVKKDPAKVLQAIKSNPYDEEIFKNVHNAAMQLPTQSADWKALRNANFYQFYQSVLLSDKYKISDPVWLQVAQLQVDYYKRDLNSHGNNTVPTEQMALVLKHVSASRNEILTMPDEGVDIIRKLDELDVIKNSSTRVSFVIAQHRMTHDADPKRLATLAPDPFKATTAHLLPPVDDADTKAIQAAFVRFLGMQRNNLAKIPYQKWIWLRLTMVTQPAPEWPSMGSEALHWLLDLVWEALGDNSKAGNSDRKNGLEVLGRAIVKKPVPTKFFETQGEHIFPMIARLVLTDTKAFTSSTEKSQTCKRLQACVKLAMAGCPEPTKRKLNEQMMPIFLPVLFKLRSLSNAPTANAQTQLATDTVKTWTDIGKDLGITQESALQDMKDKSGGLVGCSRVRCPLFGQTALGMMRCSRCKKKQYCDERCQKRDWTEGKHKEECKPDPNAP